MKNFNPVEVLNTFKAICDKHAGEIHSAGLDWDILELESARYGGKIQYPVPLILVDFK